MAVRDSDELFLPDLCGLRPLFLVLLLAQSLAIVLTLAEDGPLSARFEAFGFTTLFTQLTALSIAAVLCVTRRWLSRLPEVLAVAVSYGLMLLVSFGVAEIAWWALAAPDVAVTFNTSRHISYLARIIGISAIVNAFALRYFFVQHHSRRQVISESRARIQALQARIRPHFFFNCMNTIASLTRSSPARAERAIEDLADLFRASLADARALVTLADELDLARRYLAIEHLRLGDRLDVRWDVAALPVDARLPSLTLQPLLENAIYHGIEPLPDGGTIRIRGMRREDELCIEIENPVQPPPALPAGGNRIAQLNIGERLAAHFGAQAGLQVEQTADSYRVRMKFPYVSGDADPDR